MGYTLPQWLMFFYLYCFFGWVFETTYVSLKEHHFVNRGFLRAPLLPLYGTGAVVMLVCAAPMEGNLVLTYFAGVVGATALEYVVGVGMEALFKVKYWDYSHLKFNFQGRICLSSSIAWGFLTLLMTEIVHRPVARWVTGMPELWLGFALGAFSVTIISDTVVSVKAALDLRRMLERMTRVRQELEELQLQAALAKMEARDQLEGIKESFEEGKQRQALRIQEIKSRIAAAREEFAFPTSVQLDELRRLLPDSVPLLDSIKTKISEYNQITAGLSFIRRSLLKGNPGASSMSFGNALRELQSRVGRKKDSGEKESR